MPKPPGGRLLRKTRLLRKSRKAAIGELLRKRIAKAPVGWTRGVGWHRVDLRNARSRRLQAALEALTSGKIPSDEELSA